MLSIISKWCLHVCTIIAVNPVHLFTLKVTRHVTGEHLQDWMRGAVVGILYFRHFLANSSQIVCGLYMFCLKPTAMQCKCSNQSNAMQMIKPKQCNANTQTNAMQCKYSNQCNAMQMLKATAKDIKPTDIQTAFIQLADMHNAFLQPTDVPTRYCTLMYIHNYRLHIVYCA